MVAVILSHRVEDHSIWITYYRVACRTNYMVQAPLSRQATSSRTVLAIPPPGQQRWWWR